MEPARTVGQGFFPLDEELALPAGSSLTPRQQEHLAHLSSWMPFERAAQLMERLLGVQVSEATTRRQTEQAGVLAQAVQVLPSNMVDKSTSPLQIPLGPVFCSLAVQSGHLNLV